MQQGNKVFREEALERLSSPEQLDKLMRVVKPQTWLPLASMGCLVPSPGQPRCKRGQILLGKPSAFP